MDSKQFAWTYMVLNGYANVLKSYYGGYDPIDKNVASPKAERFFDRYNAYNEAFCKMIKEVGVDWEKTAAPSSDYEFEFAGTDCDSDRVEYMKGRLVLKNGYVQTWISDHRIEDLARNVFDMMAAIDELKGKYVEIFGE